METRSGSVVVTGVAGFIGSHLAERLLGLGFDVLGVDSFTDYYPRSAKEANLGTLRRHPRFRFLEKDILDLGRDELMDKTNYLFHQAAQAGVRGSWGRSFADYERCNVLATQKILELAKNSADLKGLVFASSSSVYGNAERFPTPEDTTPRPVSPYGVTKLACEHLCRVYHESFGVPVVTLRYFTAYGPRQRPDMAFHRFIRALANDDELVVYGDGQQTRDFTYVSDIVDANILALNPSAVGKVLNIGGGSRTTLMEVLKVLESVANTKARVRFMSAQEGDARHTSADIGQARGEIGYTPRVALHEGLGAEWAWFVRESGPAVPLGRVAFSERSSPQSQHEPFVSSPQG